MSNYTDWFDILAGKVDRQGLRDKIIHHRGLFQVSYTTDTEVDEFKLIGHVGGVSTPAPDELGGAPASAAGSHCGRGAEVRTSGVGREKTPPVPQVVRLAAPPPVGPCPARGGPADPPQRPIGPA
jgi:hypothetical protein